MFYVIYPKIGKVREKVEKLDILGKSRKFWKRRQIMTLRGPTGILSKKYHGDVSFFVKF